MCSRAALCGRLTAFRVLSFIKESQCELSWNSYSSNSHAWMYTVQYTLCARI